MGTELDQYYIFISSNEFDNVYPLNTNTTFSIDLPSNLCLNTGWEVALKELWIKSQENREQVDLCADFCVETLVNGKFIPLLRRIELKKAYNHIMYDNPDYCNISRGDLKHVSFFIIHPSKKDLSFIKGEVTVKVHFRRRLSRVF